MHRIDFKSVALPCCLLSGLFVLSGCGPKEAPVDADPVVLEVGGREIHLSEVRAHAEYLAESNRLYTGEPAEFIEDYAARQIALEQAKALGLDRDVGLQRQWENLLIGRLRQAQLDSALAEIEVSESEVAEHYHAQIDAYTKPAQIRLALLFLEASDPASKAAATERLEEAKEAVAKLDSKARGFGALAMTYSEEATSRFKGGDIGWLKEGEERYRWPDVVVEAGFALQAQGSISPVIETGEGVYLLMKLDAREPSIRPLDERLHASISDKLLREKRAQLREHIEQDWEQNIAVVYHQEAVSKFELPTTHSRKTGSDEFTRLP